MKPILNSSLPETSGIEFRNFFLRSALRILAKQSGKQSDGRKRPGTVVKGCDFTRLFLLLSFILFNYFPLAAGGQQTSEASTANLLPRRDGQHDFDFEIGTWKTHLKLSSRNRHPFTGPITWSEYEGTSVVRKIWNGRANLVELEVDGPTGHVEGLNLRLYNPDSHQWSLNFANSKVGIMSVPTVGEFMDGRGEFYDQETIDGRVMLVRNVWSDITPDSCHFEQAFSEDGGKTWEVNWVVTDTRVKDQADKTQ